MISSRSCTAVCLMDFQRSGLQALPQWAGALPPLYGTPSPVELHPNHLAQWTTQQVQPTWPPTQPAPRMAACYSQGCFGTFAPEKAVSFGQTSIAQSLPPDLLPCIFSFLDFQDKLQAQLVCKTWLKVLRSPADREVWGQVTVDVEQLATWYDDFLPSSSGLRRMLFCFARWLKQRAPGIAAVGLDGTLPQEEAPHRHAPALFNKLLAFAAAALQDHPVDLKMTFSGKGAVEELDKMLWFASENVQRELQLNVVSLRLIKLPEAFTGNQSDLDIICSLTRLTSLAIQNLHEDTWGQSAEPPPHLRERWVPLDDKGLLTELRALSCLRSLDIPASLRGLGERALSGLVHLTSLTLTCMGRQGTLAPAAELPSLLKLSVRTALVLELPGQLALPHLTHLHLHNVKRMAGCISSLSTLQSLRRLSCDEVTFGTRDDGWLFSGAIGALAALTAVSLSSVHTFDHYGHPYDSCLQLASLSALTSLENLCVSSCSLDNHNDMPDNLVSLRRLDLSHNFFSHMPRLVGHTAVSHIDLQQCWSGLDEDSDLIKSLSDQLATLPALKELLLYQDEYKWDMESLSRLADIELRRQASWPVLKDIDINDINGSCIWSWLTCAYACMLVQVVDE